MAPAAARTTARSTAAAGTGANGVETNGEAAPAEEPEAAVEAAAPYEEPVAVVPEPEAAKNGDPDEDWGYVPMSEWGDELK